MNMDEHRFCNVTLKRIIFSCSASALLKNNGKNGNCRCFYRFLCIPSNVFFPHFNPVFSILIQNRNPKDYCHYKWHHYKKQVFDITLQLNYRQTCLCLCQMKAIYVNQSLLSKFQTGVVKFDLQIKKLYKTHALTIKNKALGR